VWGDIAFFSICDDHVIMDTIPPRPPSPLKVGNPSLSIPKPCSLPLESIIRENVKILLNLTSSEDSSFRYHLKSASYKFPTPKGYDLRSKFKLIELSCFGGGLTMGNPLAPSVGRKSHLVKEQQKVVQDIKKGNNS
jgi:hypothetical protein